MLGDMLSLTKLLLVWVGEPGLESWRIPAGKVSYTYQRGLSMWSGLNERSAQLYANVFVSWTRHQLA